MVAHLGPPRLSATLFRAATLLLVAVLLGMPGSEALAQAAGGAPAAARPIAPGSLAPLIAPPAPRVLPPAQPEIMLPAAPAPEAPPPPSPGPPVRVDQVRVEGVTVYDDATIRPLYADVVGKPVARARLDDIVQALQTRYRADGYILTLVRGEFAKSGAQVIFVVKAIEGYIGEVKLDGDIGPAGELVLRMLQHLVDKRPVNNRDLERYLLLANDIPGVTARAVLRREGSEPGAVTLIAQLSRKEVSGLLNFDNRGPPEAGPPEILVSGAANSFTNFGERTEALLFSTFNREQIFGQINLDGFVTSDGLRVRSYYGHGDSKPGGILQGVIVDSGLEIGGAAVSYPIVRSRRFNIYTDGDIDTYHSSITTFGAGPSLSDLWMARIGTTIDFQEDWLLQSPAASALNVKISHGFIGSSATRALNDVHFYKVTGDFTRVQDLFTIGSMRTALKTAVGGQYSQDILPPSEKYFLGGTRFGRGFYNGEVTGDRAIGASVELQLNTSYTDVPFINPSYRLPIQYYGFWDYGRGYNLAPRDIDHTIQSVGLGFRSDLTPWLFLECEGVHRLTVRPEGANVPRRAEYAFFTRVTLHY